ncbi:DNA polymerase III PolC-type [Streptomyces californicus]
MGGEQQPRHGRPGVRQQGGGAVARPGHVGERGAHRADARDPGPARADLAAAAQHVEAHRAQRATECMKTDTCPAFSNARRKPEVPVVRLRHVVDFPRRPPVRHRPTSRRPDAVTKPPFTHLHVHTQYSLLDGAARLKDMFEAANEMGMTHIAMTDHGNLHGAYDFFHSAQKAEVTPIIGIEAYVAPESRKHKRKVQWGQPHQKRDDVSGSGGYTHKTIWAANRTGLHNLFRLSSDAYAEGWLQKWPRMDKETISQWSEGLIASTGCPSGEVQTRLRLGQFDEAVQAASDYKDIFGEGRYFLELMDHGIEIERRVRDGLLVDRQEARASRRS